MNQIDLYESTTKHFLSIPKVHSVDGNLTSLRKSIFSYDHHQQQTKCEFTPPRETTFKQNKAKNTLKDYEDNIFIPDKFSVVENVESYRRGSQRERFSSEFQPRRNDSQKKKINANGTLKTRNEKSHDDVALRTIRPRYSVSFLDEDRDPCKAKNEAINGRKINSLHDIPTRREKIKIRPNSSTKDESHQDALHQILLYEVKASHHSSHLPKPEEGVTDFPKGDNEVDDDNTSLTSSNDTSSSIRSINLIDSSDDLDAIIRINPDYDAINDEENGDANDRRNFTYQNLGMKHFVAKRRQSAIISSSLETNYSENENDHDDNDQNDALRNEKNANNSMIKNDKSSINNNRINNIKKHTSSRFKKVKFLDDVLQQTETKHQNRKNKESETLVSYSDSENYEAVIEPTGNLRIHFNETERTQKQERTRADSQSSREIHMKALSELQTSSALRARPDVVYGTMIPEPDYSDDEGDTKTSNTSSSNKMVARNNRVNTNGTNNSPQKENKCDNSRFDEKGLILPKKLPNPCLESTDKKSLHRELLFNQKLGISVLNQKSELQKAMEKHKGKQALKEQEKEKQTQVTPLQRAIDERAQRLEKSKDENKEKEEKKSDSETSSEFQKVHAKFRSKIDAK